MSRFCVWAEDAGGRAIAVAWTECRSGQTAVRRLVKALSREEYERTERVEARVPTVFDVDFVPGEEEARLVFLSK